MVVGRGADGGAGALVCQDKDLAGEAGLDEQRNLRAKLQKKNAKSAKRRLKARARKEQRHVKNTNHIIAKEIVTEAERTSDFRDTSEDVRITLLAALCWAKTPEWSVTRWGLRSRALRRMPPRPSRAIHAEGLESSRTRHAVRAFRWSKSIFKAKVRTTLRSSYSLYYRQMLPPLLVPGMGWERLRADAREWSAGLVELHQRFLHRFARIEPRESAPAYMRGLISALERKNGWTLVEEAGHAGPDRIHRLLNRIEWDADEVLDDVRDYVVEHLGDPEAVLIVDDTGFLKKGVGSDGVQRQYSGIAGACISITAR
jgi:hypothetical protein